MAMSGVEYRGANPTLREPANSLWGVGTAEEAGDRADGASSRNTLRRYLKNEALNSCEDRFESKQRLNK